MEEVIVLWRFKASYLFLLCNYSFETAEKIGCDFQVWIRIESLQTVTFFFGYIRCYGLGRLGLLIMSYDSTKMNRKYRGFLTSIQETLLLWNDTIISPPCSMVPHDWHTHHIIKLSFSDNIIPSQLLSELLNKQLSSFIIKYCPLARMILVNYIDRIKSAFNCW